MAIMLRWFKAAWLRAQLRHIDAHIDYEERRQRSHGARIEFFLGQRSDVLAELRILEYRHPTRLSSTLLAGGKGLHP
jgi:hypothetical protein